MKRLKKSVRNKRGTTLIEMVATVAILAIIASLSFEAMFMATEEFRRVESISQAERSISLFQDNLNLHTKNAIKIEFIDNHAASYSASDTIYDAMSKYMYNRGKPGSDPLQDAENKSGDKYIDLFIYRSDDFTYTIGKYQYGKGATEFKKILEVDNIKEINFSIKDLKSSFKDVSTRSFLLDYAVVSPTNFEMLAADKSSVSSGDVIDKSNYSNKEGSYSVMTGTVLNNIEDTAAISGVNKLKICEDLTGVASAGNYKGDFNFVVIRTVPREAK